MFYDIVYSLSFIVCILAKNAQKAEIDKLKEEIRLLREENRILRESKQSDRLEQIAYINEN